MLSTCTATSVGGVDQPTAPVAAPVTTVVSTTVVSPTVAAPAGPGVCVDLNSATVEQLDTIVHIGSARAAEIVRLRPFSSVDDLVRVSGIGAARLRDIVAQGRVCP